VIRLQTVPSGRSEQSDGLMGRNWARGGHGDEDAACQDAEVGGPEPGTAGRHSAEKLYTVSGISDSTESSEVTTKKEIWNPWELEPLNFGTPRDSP
jgi:hypothetical protein